MNSLSAGDIVGYRYLRVDAEARLADVLHQVRSRRASHVAVFERGALLGVVSLQASEIATPDRIFADLLPAAPFPEVGERCTLEEVGIELERSGSDAAIVRSTDGRFIGIISQQDLWKALLADSKRRIHEIAQLQGRQERLRILGQMAAGIAHNLSNSLMPLQYGLDQIREQGTLPEVAGDALSMAWIAAGDIKALVERLRDFYRDESTNDRKELVDLGELIGTVRDLTRPKWLDQARAGGRLFEVSVETEEAPLVLGNSSEIREVLVNLVVNAVDAMPEGGTITLRLRGGDETAILEVEDTGTGMDEEQRRACVTPFFSTKGESGTGLGLSVSKEIVDRHGGAMDIDSTPDEGTTFRITLPACGPSGAPSEEVDIATPAAGRVLFIDDDPLLRRVVFRLLGERGILADLSESGSDGIQRFRTGSYDIVITDLGMPEMDGLEVTRAIKELEPSTKVILLSGWDSESLLLTLDVSERPDRVINKTDAAASLGTAIAQLRRS